MLNLAEYSQHTSSVFYYANVDPYPTQLFYPGRPGAYPPAYVAQGKHANYATIDECNSGGFLGTDSCVNVNTTARLSGGEWLNVGSSSFPFIDCVKTTNWMHPSYIEQNEECYWSDEYFFGWYSSAQGVPPTGYGTYLLSRSF